MKNLIVTTVVALIVIALWIAVGGVVVRFFWNWIVPNAFGGRTIGWEVAALIWIVISVFTSFIRPKSARFKGEA